MEKTDNWAAFGGEYIKAVDVLNDTDEYAIVNVSSKTENNKEVLHLHIERNELKKLFGCNKTNTQAVQLECINSPKEAIGRKITFSKVKVTKPNTNPPEIVDGLRLRFVKESIPEENSGIKEDGTI